MSDLADRLPVRPAPVVQATLLTNRGLWKQVIYATAFITYLSSFLFFGLAAAAVTQSGPTMTAIFDMVVALYFLFQVIFLFLLSWFVERRRQNLPITFRDRRGERGSLD